MSNSDHEEPRYWFPAKTHGWGWGLPATWEGWVTLIVFVVVCGGSPALTGGSVASSIAIIVLAACALLAIAYSKGEPPRWRWGSQPSVPDRQEN